MQVARITTAQRRFWRCAVFACGVRMLIRLVILWVLASPLVGMAVGRILAATSAAYPEVRR